MELINKKVIDYVNDVDSSLPSPGGGSVSSLIGALGISLAKMACHFSFTKKKFNEAEVSKKEKFVLSFKELEHYKDLLVKGVDDDAISYESVVDAFKTKDADAINRALLTSTLVAYDIQDASLNALYYVEKLIELCNKNLYSDLVSAAILLDACNETSSLNVVANASLLKDETLKEKYLEETKSMVKKSKTLKNRILRKITKQ